MIITGITYTRTDAPDGKVAHNITIATRRKTDEEDHAGAFGISDVLRSVTRGMGGFPFPVTFASEDDGGDEPS